jgi:membrane protease YdiL (CAAX protease family)
MKERVKLIVALDLLFLLLLVIAGSVSSYVLSECFHYSAFIVPILLGFVYIFKDKSENKCKLWLLPKKETIPFALLVFLPTIAVVITASIGEALLKNAILKTASSTPDEAFATAVLLHALIPAVLEELLFRYLPVRILGANGGTVLISAVLFSFAHTDLFAIPHTLIAGIVLAALVIICKSPLPAIALHFTNNALSLVTTYYSDAAPFIILAIIIGALISVALITLKRKSLQTHFAELTMNFTHCSYAPLVFIAASLFIALTKLF